MDVRFRAWTVRFRTGPSRRRKPAQPARGRSNAAAAPTIAEDHGGRSRAGWRSRTTSVSRPTGWVPRSRPTASRRPARRYGLNLTSTTTTRSATAAANRFPRHGRRQQHPDERQLQDRRGHSASSCRGAADATRSASTRRALTTNNPTEPVQPAARFEPGGARTRSRCCGTSRSTRTRQNLLQSQKNLEIADVQLRQRLTQTSRDVRNAYFNLVNAIGQLQVAQKSLELAQTSLKNNEKTRRARHDGADRHRPGARPKSRGPRNRSSSPRARFRPREDNLRVLIMNPSQPDFWTTKLEPADRPTLAPQPLDVDAAIKNALANRTDLHAGAQAARTDRHQHEVSAEPEAARARCHRQRTTSPGVAGTQFQFDRDRGVSRRRSSVSRSAASRDSLRDVVRQRLQDVERRSSIVSYPIGTSAADAGLAQARLQRDQQTTNLRDLETIIVAQVRDAGAAGHHRASSGSRRRRKRAQLAEQNLQAYEKRLAVGLSDTFRLFQAQRDLTTPAEQRAGRDHRLQPRAD